MLVGTIVCHSVLSHLFLLSVLVLYADLCSDIDLFLDVLVLCLCVEHCLRQ